jgi:hypothetical protein
VHDVRVAGWSFPPASLHRHRDRTISSSSGSTEEGRRMVSEDSRVPSGDPEPFLLVFRTCRIVTAQHPRKLPMGPTSLDE